MSNKKNGNKFSKGSKNGSYKRDNYKKDWRADPEHPSRTNDISWYSKNPQLVRDAAQISLNPRIGSSISMATSGSFDNYDGSLKEYVPSIITYGVTPTYGFSEGASSALNVAAQNFYSFVRRANSGSRNYQIPDLMLAYMAVDQAYTMYAHLGKIYGIANNYTGENAYLTEGLLKACGVSNIDDLLNNLANYRLRLNILGYKLNTLWIPKDFHMTNRHFALMSGVYADNEDTQKTQIYVFHPAGYYIYDQTAYESGGCLKYKDLLNYDFGLGSRTFAGWLSILEDMIESLIMSEDIGIMTGDIRKAYGEGNLAAVMPVTEDHRVKPWYDTTMAEQIRNIIAVGPMYRDSKSISITQGQDPDTILGRDIVQKGQVLYNLPAVYQTPGADAIIPLIDMMKTNPTAEDFMEASRLMAHTVATDGFPLNIPSDMDYSTDTPYLQVSRLMGFGSEIVHYFCILIRNGQSSGYVDTFNDTPGVIWVPNANEDGFRTFANVGTSFISFIENSENPIIAEATMIDVIRNTANTEAFAFAPTQYILRLVGRDTNINTLDEKYYLNVRGHFNNFGQVTFQTIDNMHDTAMMSLLNVPHL